jgi:hypothetical protein
MVNDTYGCYGNHYYDMVNYYGHYNIVAMDTMVTIHLFNVVDANIVSIIIYLLLFENCRRITMAHSYGYYIGLTTAVTCYHY